MKSIVISAVTVASLVVPCKTLFIEEESQALTSWGSSAAQPIQEWVSRRQVARDHLHELSDEDNVRRNEEAAIYLPRTSTGLKTSAFHKMFDMAQPPQGRMIPRTQKSDRLHDAKKELKEGHHKVEQVAAVSDVNVAAKRIQKQEKLADNLSHWRKMQKERATATTTPAPSVNVKHITKSQTPLTERYRNRRLASQQAAELKQPLVAEPAALPKQQQVKEAAVTHVNVTEVMVKDGHLPTQAEPVQQTAQKKAEEAKVTKVKVGDVKVTNPRPPMQAEQLRETKIGKIEEVEKANPAQHADKSEIVEKAKITNVKVLGVEVKDVQPPMPAEQAMSPEQDKVEKAKVTNVKVTNVKVTEPELTTQAEEQSLPNQGDLKNAQTKEAKARDVKVKELQQTTPAKQAVPSSHEKVGKAKVLDTKVTDVKVVEAQPPKQAKKPNQLKIEAEAADAYVVGAHVSAATRSVLSCVCSGEFAQGDRINYVGHAFPPGRTTGTVMAGTKNGYLNIEWDNFHEGHTGNCQLSSCGACENTTVASRWFSACSDVKMLEEAPKMRLADLVFGAQ